MLCSCVCQRQEGCPNALCFPSGTHRLACSHPCSFGKQWAWPSPAPAGCGLVNCSAIPVGLLFPVDSRENSPLSYMNKNLIKKKKPNLIGKQTSQHSSSNSLKKNLLCASHWPGIILDIQSSVGIELSLLSDFTFRSGSNTETVINTHGQVNEKRLK